MRISDLINLLILLVVVQLSLAHVENVDDNSLRGLNGEHRERSLSNSNSNQQQTYYGSPYYKNLNNKNYFGSTYYGRNHYNYIRNGYYFRPYRGGYYVQGQRTNSDYYIHNSYYESNTDDSKTSTTNIQNNGSVIDSVVNNLFQFYQTSPSQWTRVQWIWFSGALVASVLLLLCCCICCASLCLDAQTRTFRIKDAGNYDDYASMDSSKRDSFATGMSTNVATVNDSMDDDSTYDSIMRLRSSP